MPAIVQWKTDIQFNYGSPVKTNVEVVGSGDDAFLRLQKKADGQNNAPFTTPVNYDFDPAKIEVVGGCAKLKASTTGSHNWPFTTPANYTYDPSKIEIVGGVAKLKGNPVTPYALYHLNASNGSQVLDSSGNSRHGTCIDMEDTDWVPGKLNNCLSFGEGGDREYVDFGDIAGFERTDSFSLEFWLKTTSGSWPTFLGKMGPAPNRTGYEFGFQSGILRLRLIHILNTDSIVVRNNTVVNDGAWHHIVVTYDGSSTAAGINFYVDGNLCSGNTVDHDNLTGSIHTGASFWMGYRSSTSLFDGDIDEAVVYDKELAQAEVTKRWNSGSGTEDLLGSYSIDNPPIFPNAGFAFNHPLETFSETGVKPADTETKYHISADDGLVWKYWDGVGWTATDDSYAQANTVVEVNAHISSLGGSGTLKVRALLHTSDEAATPELDNTYVAEGPAYPIGSFDISMKTDMQPAIVYAWTALTELVVKPIGTDVEYQYSIDGGLSWSGAWLEISLLLTALQGETLKKDGTDKVRFKFRLSTSDADKTPEIDNLAVTSSAGYETSGNYVSTAFYPGQVVRWETLTFESVTPRGTTLTISVIRSIHPLDPTSVYATKKNGSDLYYDSACFKWRATMTGDGETTPRLNWLELIYHFFKPATWESHL